MFAIDEYVYYASEGICRIADICRAPLKGMPEDRLYYILHPVRVNGGVLYVPTDSDSVFLRRLLTADEAEQLLNEIPVMEAFEETNAKALRLRYNEAMHTHAPSEWVRVIKTVRRRMECFAGAARSQRISETERGFAEDAKRYLYTELSLALNVPVGEMEQFISRHIARRLA